MSYPRVNLLKKSEQRYQGAVSRRFMLVSIVVTPILLVAVLSGIKLVQYSGIRSDLKASRELWATLEPRLALYKEESRILNDNKNILSLFESWQASQVPLVELMDEVQDVVPLNIQFSRLVVRGEVFPGIYEKSEDMELGYKLDIGGIALGDRAEEDVWKLQKDLQGGQHVGKAFEFVDLTDMRKQQSRDGSSIREFRIVGSNDKGGR